MDKSGVVAVLREIAILLEIAGENVFKCRAYENAARALEGESASLDELIASGKLGSIKGIGKELTLKITELAQTGKLAYYDELRARVPPGLLELIRVPGLGPKKAKLLFEELGIASLGELEYACNENRLVGVKGLGAKSQAKILEGVAFVRSSAGRFHHARVLPHAEALLAHVLAGPGVLRADIAGSIRRGRETVKDLDIVAAADDAAPLMKWFLAAPGVESVIGSGPTKSSVRLASGLQADLRVVTDAQYPYALHHFTGSKEHNSALRALAKERGLKLNEYGLWRGATLVPCADEADLFAALGLAYIPPELREDTGELEAAARGELPTLIERSDIVGAVHVHSVYSDGADTIAALRRACAERGLRYLVICDHSKSAAYAGGLSLERVAEQHREIDQLNREDHPVRVLKGIEADILGDGEVDYDDDVLARFDLVIASVHSRFNLDLETMTARVCRALAHPRVHMLGHPSGRLLLSRDAYPLDIERVLQTAKQYGKGVELNAHPYRLDLDWRACKRARELGVPISVNPDAHAAAGLDDIAHGVTAARRGWLERRDVANTLPWEKFRARFG